MPLLWLIPWLLPLLLPVQLGWRGMRRLQVRMTAMPEHRLRRVGHGTVVILQPWLIGM